MKIKGDWVYRMGHADWAVVLMVVVILGVIVCAAVYA